MKFLATVATATLFVATAAFAGGHANWASVDGESSVAFGSIKNDTAGEVHHFSAVKGSVSEAGELAIMIDVSSVETNIDIRNERMTEHVFQGGSATAVLSGEIDMEELTALEVGATRLMDIEGTLTFGGLETDVEAKMLVARLGEDRVLVTTADFIMLSTEDLGIDAGIDALMELASLSGITRVTPVSVRMVFEK
ncbi:YceI family protein [Roseobacter sp. YSTF-M11]|uniref:YceI family protein n=1 Tax=Roseobacter insulae TaxID=2859783 RepID=A0A9X1FT31_9RHOB|nr:YceI family protein [Roseobacter insulae]MBW4707178.1 YceI family protein [Roseobacter insulae]